MLGDFRAQIRSAAGHVFRGGGVLYFDVPELSPGAAAKVIRLPHRSAGRRQATNNGSSVIAYAFVKPATRSEWGRLCYDRASHQRSPAMRKLVAVTILAAAAVALATQSAAACDWNREASTAQQQVATSTAPAEPSQTTATTSSQTANTASSKPAEPTAPIVRVSDRN
jgi:hypothetical protein